MMRDRAGTNIVGAVTLSRCLRRFDTTGATAIARGPMWRTEILCLLGLEHAQAKAENTTVERSAPGGTPPRGVFLIGKMKVKIMMMFFLGRCGDFRGATGLYTSGSCAGRSAGNLMLSTGQPG